MAHIKQLHMLLCRLLTHLANADANAVGAEVAESQDAPSVSCRGTNIMVSATFTLFTGQDNMLAYLCWQVAKIVAKILALTDDDDLNGLARPVVQDVPKPPPVVKAGEVHAHGGAARRTRTMLSTLGYATTQVEQIEKLWQR